MLLKKYKESLIAKMILSGGVTLLLCVFLWAGFNVYYFKRNVVSGVMSDIDMVSDTIMLALHYAMMLDSEDDIKQNINNISRQEEIRNIRVYNKQGRIVFSNEPEEVDTIIDHHSPACWTCHQYSPTPPVMPLTKRTRIIEGKDGAQYMAIMTPIPNSEGCSPGPCHVHNKDEQILGLLDVTVAMGEKNAMIATFERANLTSSVLVFLATFASLFLFTYRFIFRPIRKVIGATREYGATEHFAEIDLEQDDEIGTLGRAFNGMARRISENHRALREQREEFRNLFDNVPCLVSVVDADYRVIRHNSAYESHFGTPRGKRCWQINKGRLEKCEICPVDRTFADGRSHISEESGMSKDGRPIHWIVYTSPVRDQEGKVVAAMEMMVDITWRKELEQRLALSEHRYHAIFDSIPSAVFVLDRETLEILNCNESARDIYGWEREDLQGRSFLTLFRPEEADDWAGPIRTCPEIELCTQVTQSGEPIFVFVRISPADFDKRDALIAVCTDVTRKVVAEQQVIQASKMSTLGEMSTGVAHELNQPLTILQAISNLLTRKVRRKAPIEPEILEEMAEGISTHVNRASKIIEHMREFGRKSDMKTMPVDINGVLRRGFEFFSQQLSVHNIEVIWDLKGGLPMVMADSNRLEQVVVNLLLNARDAIEERWTGKNGDADKRIHIRSFAEGERVCFRICDTGTGIPTAIRDRLFEPFFTTKNVGKGTGLGLSISYGIVTDYGGDITARAWEPGGACFEVSFPRAACEL
ncbi:PAS domain-containing protein [Pseudodesulfovibrio sp.]|uniref:PAS domain-containing protein n=1 Tax=Pseudodesulfovibrio sp. TaxID=2035812 RepID=UPI002636CD72|nr:PAS domain-containing protein [Pseudodesulfovibrio sp.]MDD3313118.1 PAS domain-containing protein [Pseudodesulfovibrio sp.]